MTARKLSETGEAQIRGHFGADEAEALIQDINDWMPQPPRHAPGMLARTSSRTLEVLAKVHGQDAARQMCADMDAWAESRERQKAEGKHTTLFKVWTEERLRHKRQSSAERQRRYRDRQRAAQEAFRAAQP